MTWIKIESSVARNRKFMKAGPAPSWLWLCGLAYCQEGLTDGFIPAEALSYLGVKNARQLASHLVAAGLWDVADGGWHVHDYLNHNRSASDVDAIRAKRAEGGQLGGRPTKNLPITSKVSTSKTFREKSVNPSVAVADVAADLVLDPKKKGTPISDAPLLPMDVWFRAFQGQYPAHRVSRNARTEHEFIGALTGASDGAITAWERMQSNLAANMASHEWRVKGMVPMLEKYLSNGLWENVLPPAPPAAEQVSPRTARMLGAV